jgi:hypothetical protein
VRKGLDSLGAGGFYGVQQKILLPLREKVAERSEVG